MPNLWQLSDGRWEYKRRGKQFGLLSGTSLARVWFSGPEVNGISFGPSLKTRRAEKQAKLQETKEG